jgi:hypothetical protein
LQYNTTPTSIEWFQPMLIPPQRLTLITTAYLSGPAGELGVTMELREGQSDTVSGLTATSWPLSGEGMQCLAEFIRTRACAAWEALSPF